MFFFVVLLTLFVILLVFLVLLFPLLSTQHLPLIHLSAIPLNHDPSNPHHRALDFIHLVTASQSSATQPMLDPLPQTSL